jgi:hypothetical protein
VSRAFMQRRCGRLERSTVSLEKHASTSADPEEPPALCVSSTLTMQEAGRLCLGQDLFEIDSCGGCAGKNVYKRACGKRSRTLAPEA